MGEGRSPSLKSDSHYYRSGGGAGAMPGPAAAAAAGSSSGSCGTPRHHWRSVSWTARSRDREAEANSAASSSSSSNNSGGSVSRPTSMMAGPQQQPQQPQQNAANRRGEGSDSVRGGVPGGGASNSTSNRGNDFSKQTQLLCPPLSSLTVSRSRGEGSSLSSLTSENHFPSISERGGGGGGGGGGGAGAGAGNERKSKNFFSRRNGLDIKLDLGAVRQVNFQENDAAEPSDSELSQKREKMALCEKQCSRIRPHLYFGSSVVAQDYELLKSNKILHIVNCVGYVCAEYFPNSFHYKVLWLQDSPSEDLFSVLYDCFDYFEDVKDKGERVYVHCCQGVSRSAAIVIAYLMWREGRTFEDVFDDVKSLRGVTSPNMGFAFQLMNWQSRVLGSPRSPSLRMFRMAPHSPHDPLHQVPKGVANPSRAALDSRGSFVIQFANKLYVWQGRHCGRCLVTAADKFAFQLIRYERASGPILQVKEGSEPRDLCEALMKTKGPTHSSDWSAEDGVPEGNCSVPDRLENHDISLSETGSSGAAFGVEDGNRGGAEGGECSTQDSKMDSSQRGLVNHSYDPDFEALDKAKSGQALSYLPDSTTLRGWDGRWNTARHEICCGIPSFRAKR